jgi:CelD/BcsL family acetyltransferase involved in cellulose biosynthesis
MVIKTDNGQYQVHVLSRHDLTPDIIEQWLMLEQRSVEGNAYLSPHFILPSIKYLTPNTEVVIILVTYSIGNTTILTGVGVFEYWRWTKRLPLPHFKAYRSPHSYLSGLLVDEEFMDSTLSAFFAFFSKTEKYSCGVEFINRTEDTKLAERLQIAASHRKICFREYNRKQRAILIPQKINNEYFQKTLTPKLKKTLRYGHNVLSKTGAVDWRIVEGHQVRSTCIDDFLRLEHMGWKGANCTSLLSKPEETAFFREMINGFAQHGRVFFTELQISNRTVASTVNLISSKKGFAFKIGWDTEFAAASPGMLNEVELLKQAPKLISDLEYIDSGADEGSFIEKLWTDRYTLVSGFYVTRLLAVPLLASYNVTRRIKHRVLSYVKRKTSVRQG